MSDIDIDVDGLAATVEELDELDDEWSDGGRWHIGTAVNYGIYLEYGTSKMDPKPFFRPALHAYRSNLESAIDADTKTTLEDIESAEELVKVVAFGLERRVKRIITKKGLIETGTLRASVQATRTPSDLPTADEIDAEADVEVNV